MAADKRLDPSRLSAGSSILVMHNFRRTIAASLEVFRLKYLLQLLFLLEYTSLEVSLKI